MDDAEELKCEDCGKIHYDAVSIQYNGYQGGRVRLTINHEAADFDTVEALELADDIKAAVAMALELAGSPTPAVN